jgi:hypothetical protein
MTIDAIKEAIQHLPKDQRSSLVGWPNEMEYDGWDKEMAADFSPGGRRCMGPAAHAGIHTSRNPPD